MINSDNEKIASELKITETSSLSIKPYYHVLILHCAKPKKLVYIRREYTFETKTSSVIESKIFSNFGWIIAFVLSQNLSSETKKMIPGRAGFNSLISDCKSLTNVNALPLLPEVAHDWSTLLTVITQAVQLKNLVVGEDRS